MNYLLSEWLWILKKTYIILSPHIDNPKLYFDNDWKSIDKTTDYVDLIFLEGAKYKRYDKIRVKPVIYDDVHIIVVNPFDNYQIATVSSSVNDT